MDKGLEVCRLSTFPTDLALPSDSNSVGKGGNSQQSCVDVV